MTESPYIKAVTRQSFSADVIEKSNEAPVLVDFWAGWCNPCKMLMPILAKLADEYQGKFYLAKVDTDVERELAEQFGIRSLPTVKVFKFGDIVDEFMGVLPEGEIRSVIERNLVRDSDFTFTNAMDALKSGDTNQAETLLRQLWEQDASDKKVSVALARLYLNKGEARQASEVMSKIGVSALNDPDVEEIEAKLTFAVAVENAPNFSALEQQVTDNPKDFEAWYQLGARYAVIGEYEKSLEAFFQSMMLKRDYQEQAARKGMLAVFTILGSGGPLVNKYRAKIASALH